MFEILQPAPSHTQSLEKQPQPKCHPKAPETDQYSPKRAHVALVEVEKPGPLQSREPKRRKHTKPAACCSGGDGGGNGGDGVDSHEQMG